VKPIPEMTLPELAAYVSSHLKTCGVQAVLSGGGCVTVYSDNAYQSYDLDFIENLPTPIKKLTEIMCRLGFDPKSRYFVHPQTPYFVEFPPGPLSIGDEPATEIIERRYDTGVLTLISPTECVKDRLAAYYHWNDRQCLRQAELVARCEGINLAEVERWSKHEGKGPEFARIRHLLVSKPPYGRQEP